MKVFCSTPKRNFSHDIIKKNCITSSADWNNESSARLNLADVETWLTPLRDSGALA